VQVAQLRMTSQMATIRMKQIQGKQHIEQPQAILHMKQLKAELKVHTTPSKLSIDQSKAWEDMNLMSIAKRITVFGQSGLQAAQEGAGRRAKEGRELMEIENEASPIIEQAARNAHPRQKPLGIDFIPSPFSVQTTYRPSEVNIDVIRHEPSIRADVNKPIHHYERGDVIIDMDKYADLQIDVVNLYA